MSATSHSLQDEYSAYKAELSQSNETTQDKACPETLENDILCINKKELINSFYQLHQNNILINDQIKQYREIVEFLESKMKSNNESNKKKQQQIYDTILKVKKLIQTGGMHTKHTKINSKKGSKHSKHSKKQSKCSKRSKQKHSKCSKHSNQKHSKHSKRSNHKHSKHSKGSKR